MFSGLKRKGERPKKNITISQLIFVAMASGLGDNGLSVPAVSKASNSLSFCSMQAMKNKLPEEVESVGHLFQTSIWLLSANY